VSTRRSSSPTKLPAAELASRAASHSGGPSVACKDPGAHHRSRYCTWAFRGLGICLLPQLLRCFWDRHGPQGDLGEYGLATLELDTPIMPVSAPLAGTQQVWMSPPRTSSKPFPEASHIAGHTQHLRNCRDGRPGAISTPLQYHRSGPYAERGKESSQLRERRPARACRIGTRQSRALLSEQEIRDCVGQDAGFLLSSAEAWIPPYLRALARALLGADLRARRLCDSRAHARCETDFLSAAWGNLSVEPAGTVLGALAPGLNRTQTPQIIGEDLCAFRTHHRCAPERW